MIRILSDPCRIYARQASLIHKKIFLRAAESATVTGACPDMVLVGISLSDWLGSTRTFDSLGRQIDFKLNLWAQKYRMRLIHFIV